MRSWLIPLVAVICLSEAVAQLPSDAAVLEDLNPEELSQELGSEEPDEKKKERIWGNSFFAVPIPVSNPTFGNGLAVGAVYFYPQTQAQKEVQPASLTGVAGFYSDNDSLAFGVGHQSYWGGDKWRLGGAAGYIDLKLDLVNPAEDVGNADIDWLLEGSLFVGKLSRRIHGDWYADLLVRWLDIDQTFDFQLVPDNLELGTNTRAAGVGLQVEFDSRDNPFNPYQGQLFKAGATVTEATSGALEQTYQSYNAEYRQFHDLRDNLVLGWNIRACHRSDGFPLWDACTVGLRGFNITNFLGRTTASAQAEVRWRLHGRWGAVAFAGVGGHDRSYGRGNETESVPSLGFGIRWMALESQRVNVRLDLAWSDDDNAVYLAVGEAF
jgi:hypothetical protein